jgi:hypothetical protein
MLAAAGSRRALLPHPAAEPSEGVLLVEGEPDMIAARCHLLPAIAVPGLDGWNTAWALLFSGRRVIVVMDCDEPRRGTAAAIQKDLSSVCDAEILDVAPDRNDGCDLTGRLLDTHRLPPPRIAGRAAGQPGRLSMGPRANPAADGPDESVGVRPRPTACANDLQARRRASPCPQARLPKPRRPRPVKELQDQERGREVVA